VKKGPTCEKWRRLHRAQGHVPPLLQMAGHGGTVSGKTANKKLTKLYWPSRKRLLKQLIVLLEPKKWRGTTNTKNFFRRFAQDRSRPPLSWRTGALPLSNSFRCHCVWECYLVTQTAAFAWCW